MPYTLLCFTSRKPTLTFEEYKNHYESVHAPLVTAIQGEHAPEGYTRYYTDRSPEAKNRWLVGNPAEFDYDCCTVITWKDKASYDAAAELMAKPELWGKVVADEELFLDRAKIRLVYVGEGCGPKFA